MAKVWRAPQTTAKIGPTTSLPSITTTSDLNLIVNSASPAAVTVATLKNVTITEPMAPLPDQINLLGLDTNNYQNMEFDEKPPELGKISGTLLHSGDEVFENTVLSSVTVTGGYTRFRPGKEPTSRSFIFVRLNDSANTVNFLLNNVVVKLGERKLGGADGHWEQDFEGVCLARDFIGPEFKD